MTFNFVTLTLDLKDGSGNAVTTGYATFTPSVQLTGDGLMPQAPIGATFRSTGSSPTVSLLATDNGGILPAGWAWTVTFMDVPGAPQPFTFFLPFTNGSSQNLSAQAPVSSVTTMAAYMPLPSGTATSGYVPIASGTGEASAWGPQSGGGGGGISPPAGDIGGTALSPTVVSTHLTSPLPVPQGGNGARGYRAPDISLIDTPWMGGSSGPTFSLSGQASGSTADTSDFILGTQAVYATTAGTGASTKITAAFGGSPLNLTGKCLVLWVKMANLGHFQSGYPRVYLGDTNFTNVYYWKIGSASGQPWNMDGEWMRITLPFGAAATVGSPNRANLGNLIVNFFDDNTGNPITVHLGGIATMAEPASAFPNGVLSLTFDDGFLSQFNTAKPLMDALGYRGTAYVITETLWNHGSGNFNSYLDLPSAQALENYSGWEVGSHAYTAANHNADYVNIGDAAALADMQAAKAYLISEGFKAPEHFAYPLGAYDAGTIVDALSMFGSGRSISTLGGSPEETFPPAQPLRLRSLPISENSGIAPAQGYITAAAANKEWLVFTIHDVQASASGNLQLSTAHFTSLLSSIQSSGITVMPVSEVLKQSEILYASLAGAAFTGPVSLSESAAAGGVLTVVNSHTAPTAPTAQYTAQTAADLVVGVEVSGDANERFTIDSNGKLQWGPGSGAVDTTLSRVGGGVLQANSFRVSNSAAGGNVLTVTNTNAGVPTAPNVELVAHNAGDPELGIDVTGDTVFRLVVDSNGKMSWGPGGSTAADTVLQRSGAGVLQVATGHLDLNSQKITSLANGTAATDAAAFGQTVSGGAPGAVLATQYYAPGAVSDKTITTTTLAPFDTTNLTVSFTAPPSGKVMVEVTALVLPTTAVEWNLGLTLHGSPSTVIGALYNSKDGSTNTQTARPFKFYVTGLTPGNVFQYDVSGASASGSLAIACYGDTSTTPTADNIGSPFVMEVFAR